MKQITLNKQEVNQLVKYVKEDLKKLNTRLETQEGKLEMFKSGGAPSWWPKDISHYEKQIKSTKNKIEKMNKLLNKLKDEA